MQFNLCLSCGVPFLPFEDHLIDVSKLGNLSLMYLQKFVRNCEYSKKFQNPLFTTKPVESHMVHVSHHAHAIEFMRKRNNDDLIQANPNNDNGVFPFFLNPGGGNKEPSGAFWETPKNRIEFEKLVNLVSDVEFTDDRVINLDKTFLMCECCNNTMTMKFWFKHILYRGKEPLIEQNVISIVDMNSNNCGLDRSEEWTLSYNPRLRTFPNGDKDAMGAAVAYYLHMCLPEDDLDEKQKNLYQFLCWIILEISCLLCEYKIGPENNNKAKKNQLFKSHVGAIEIYISYFFWTVLQFKDGSVSRMSFVNWHQIYFCEIKNCKGMFSSIPDYFGKMIVDFFTDDIEDKNSFSLLNYVHETLLDMYGGFIETLEDYLDGKEVPDEVSDFFLNEEDLLKIDNLRNQGAGRNFDIYLKLVGVEALISRLIDTCRDLNDEIVDKLKSFNNSWQMIEVNNVSKSRYDGKNKTRSRMEYYMCKIMNAPRVVPFDLEELQKLARKKKCSHWLAVLRLRELGAF